MNDTTRKRVDKLTEEVIRRTRGCLPAEELAAYHDGTIQPQNRSTLEAHLPGCPACRAALDYLASEASSQEGQAPALPAGIEQRLQEKIDSVSSEQPYRSEASGVGPGWMKIAAGFFLAVTMATAGFLWMSPDGFDRDLGELRSQGRLEAIQPTGPSESMPDRFTWSPHPLATLYEVHLFDAEMDEIWKGRSADDSVSLAFDQEVRDILSGGGKFSWQVWALDRRDWPVEVSSINHFELVAASPTR